MEVLSHHLHGNTDAGGIAGILRPLSMERTTRVLGANDVVVECLVTTEILMDNHGENEEAE